MKRLFIAAIASVLAFASIGQSKMEIGNMTWSSWTANHQISNRWGAITDFHITGYDLMTENWFYFLRLGPTFRLHPSTTLSAGYAHIWFSPDEKSYPYGSEHWIYEEAKVRYRLKNLSSFSRVRVEHRFLKEIDERAYTGEYNYFTRLRFLQGVSIPVARRWALVVYDELMVSFGPAIDRDLFDQNRITAVMKYRINDVWSAGGGYLNLYFNRNTDRMYHTLRLFISSNFDWRR